MNSVTLERFFYHVAKLFILVFEVGGLYLRLSNNIVTLEWFCDV